jgi:hypothetical protein
MHLPRRLTIDGRRWIFFFFSVIGILFSPSLVYADLGPDPANLSVFQTFVQRLIGLIVPVGFVAMLFMLTWAGIKFLTSGGEQAALKQARETATWAMMGIVFLVLAWLLLLLIQAFTGVDVTNFKISFG